MDRTPNLERMLAASPERAHRGGYRAAADSPDAITIEEATAILGIAWSMANVGKSITSEERNFYDALVEYLAQRADRDAVVEAADAVQNLGGRMRDLAERHAAVLVRPSVRELAYKTAYMIRLWDLDTSPAEEELETLLVHWLELADIAEELAGEMSALLVSPA